MSAIVQIIVNDKTYKVQELSVLDTVYFHAEALHYLGDVIGKFLDVYLQVKEGTDKNGALAEVGKALASLDPEALHVLQPKILRQVATPENKFLDNPMNIEDWFSKPENAGDVWEVTVKAGSVLLGKCLPRFLKEAVGTMKAAAESVSQSNTTPKP